MSSTDTVAQIQQALRVEGTHQAGAAVKRVVEKSLRKVDRRISVESTDYFNHSYAPDLVVSWPHLPARPERHVYLRFNERPGWIAQDLPLIAKQHPVVYGLTAPQWNNDSDELAQRSAAAETLVTDPAGVDELASQDAGLEALVGQAVIRGGQGIVDRRRATWVTTRIAAGFEAAKVADVDLTHLATEAAAEFLRPREASRVVGFMHAMWVGGGGAPSAFPVAASEVHDPGDDGLAFLINQDEIPDPDFWRSLGREISLDRLANLGITGSPTNLQHFIYANLDRLWARACRVERSQPRLGESHGFRWRIERRLVAFSGTDFTAFFGSRTKHLKRVRLGNPVAISVDELRRRATQLHAAIDNLELTDGRRLLTWGSTDHQTDVSRDEGLDAVSQTLQGATVRKATVYVGDRHLDIDFPRTTISARTQGQPPLGDIVGVALPVLWAMDDDERQELRALARPEERQQLRLFADSDLQPNENDVSNPPPESSPG